VIDTFVVIAAFVFVAGYLYLRLTR